MKIGYKLMSEEHGPKTLVENAVAAEAAGFDFVSISDHFHPWLETQGHSPFAWSVLGAIAQATTTIGITTGLTCPILRYHPAIIAQAAATVAILSDNRFVLAVGAGERLNEHVTGARWPSIPERHAMLGEAIDIFRLLWTGEAHTATFGHFVLDHARLYDPPGQPIAVVVGISGPRGAALAGEKADGIMAVEPNAELVGEFRRRKPAAPAYAEATLAYAPSEEQGLANAHRTFRFSAFDWSVNSELPNVAGFEAATRYVRPQDLAGKVAAGPNPETHAGLIAKYADSGFDHVVLTCPGEDQLGFIRFYERELKELLRNQATTAAAE
jgi:G6PDH family F420-dependent oxidoreductase